MKLPTFNVDDDLPFGEWIESPYDNLPTIYFEDQRKFGWADLQYIERGQWRFRIGVTYNVDDISMQLEGTLEEAIAQANAIFALEEVL